MNKHINPTNTAAAVSVLAAAAAVYVAVSNAKHEPDAE